MSTYMGKFHTSSCWPLLYQQVKLLPQIKVSNGCVVLLPPAVSLPIRQPLRYAVNAVHAVRSHLKRIGGVLRKSSHASSHLCPVVCLWLVIVEWQCNISRVVFAVKDTIATESSWETIFNARAIGVKYQSMLNIRRCMWGRHSYQGWHCLRCRSGTSFIVININDVDGTSSLYAWWPLDLARWGLGWKWSSMALFEQPRLGLGA